MEKATTKEIKVGKKKKKENKRTKWTAKLGSIVKQVAWEIIENHVIIHYKLDSIYYY
jgi:hypothetical protein